MQAGTRSQLQLAAVCSKQAATKSEKSNLHTKNAQAARLRLRLSGNGCADKDSYPHDCRADNAPYRHDRRADKNHYRHNRNIRFSSKLNLCFI